MKDKIKCDDSIDCGTTCIRGWHNYKDCPHSAKYKVTFKDGDALRCSQKQGSVLRPVGQKN